MTSLLAIGQRPDRAMAGRIDRGIAADPIADQLLAANAPVAIGVSGGKDSCALALATVAHLNAIGHQGPRILVHSDLGRVEWKDSLPTCERLAAATGLELVTVKRKAGDMMDRWLGRWSNNVARYRDLECVKLILPWSTPSMRFCTSELKTDIICRALVTRFPGCTILSASGIRRDESANRRKAPVSKPQAKLRSTTRNTTGLDWHPIIEWATSDVYAYLEARGFALHEAYTRFGMSRVSCAYCIMSSEADLVASASCADNQDLYREMVDLELASTFGFQQRWLADIAPHVLDERTRGEVAKAKDRARRREAAEARIPAHLLYEAGWPKCIPTDDEARLLCDVRSEVAAIVGIEINHTTSGQLVARYRELMDENARRSAAQ